MKVNNATYSEFFEFFVPGVLLNSIGLLGFCGNILSIIVLSRPQMKSSINCILIGNILDQKSIHILHFFSIYSAYEEADLRLLWESKIWISVQMNVINEAIVMIALENQDDVYGVKKKMNAFNFPFIQLNTNMDSAKHGLTKTLLIIKWRHLTANNVRHVLRD